MLKFLIDHNIPKGVSDWLSAEHFDVRLVKDIDPEMPDRDVFDVALREQRILITNDADFIGLWTADRKVNCMIFRSKSQTSAVRIEALKKVMYKIKEDQPFGLLVLE